MSLKSKTAIITGGAGGLGKAIAKSFLEAGANVVIFDINEALLGAASQELSSLGPLHTIAVDITDEGKVTTAINDTVAKFGDLDILVNNAGIADTFDPIGALDLARWDRVLNINLRAPAVLSKLAINHFTAREKGPAGGVIVNIGSVSSLKGFSAGKSSHVDSFITNLSQITDYCVLGAAYTASKHGLAGLTKNTAAYYRDVGIRCNLLMPGAMSTNIHTAFAAGLNKEGYALVSKGMAVGAPLCDLEKLGKTCVFLAADESSVVNGAIISGDNGWLAT